MIVQKLTVPILSPGCRIYQKYYILKYFSCVKDGESKPDITARNAVGKKKRARKQSANYSLHSLTLKFQQTKQAHKENSFKTKIPLLIVNSTPKSEPEKKNKTKHLIPKESNETFYIRRKQENNLLSYSTVK